MRKLSLLAQSNLIGRHLKYKMPMRQRMESSVMFEVESKILIKLDQLKGGFHKPNGFGNRVNKRIGRMHGAV